MHAYDCFSTYVQKIRFDSKLMKVFLVVCMLADEGEASSALATPPLFPPRTNPRAKKGETRFFILL